MVQTLPQVRVFQEFTLAPDAAVQPLRAFILGPHYNVRSYEKAKDLIGLGDYLPDTNQEFLWPALEPGETVDQSFTRVWLDNALVRFLNASAGGDGYDPVAPNLLELGGTFGWAGNDYADRLPALLKDVSPGDVVRLADPADTANTYQSTVRRLVRELVASSVDADTTPETNNADTPAAPGTADLVSAPTIDQTMTLDASTYKGYIEGLITERYTFEVIQAGLPGAARMNMLSDSGLDDVLDVEVPATPAAIGALGLEVSVAGGTDTLSVGDTWVFDAHSAFTATAGSDISVTGTYTGPSDTTYIIEIVRGGDEGVDAPLFRVLTTTGIDSAAPQEAVDSGTTIGIFGLSVTFASAMQLNKGDRFTFDATAATQGRVSSLELADTIPASLTALSDVNVQVFAKRNIELTEKRFGTPGVFNWEQDATTITLNSGAVYFAEGDPLNGADIRAGSIYTGYRALSTQWANTIQTINDVGQLSSFFGDLTPENPLGFGVKLALSNANGTDVKFAAVPTNDLAGYVSVLDRTLEREDVYSFVPMTYDRAIKNLIQAHVTQQSSPEKGRWRIAWVSEETKDTAALVGDEDVVTASIEQAGTDPSGVYRLVTSADAGFLTNGVQPGDTLRYNYSIDGFGVPTYDTDTVFTVISENQVLIQTGPSSPLSTPSKIEVWRQLSLDEQVAELVEANTYASRRVYSVFAGKATIDGFVGVPDYFVAAAYAGLRSGVLPHQGLTNVQIAGIDRVPFTADTLSSNQLDSLMNAGFWLVVSDPESAAIYCRKQISTDLLDINTTEQSVTTNVDSQSYLYKRVLAPYIGRTNNVASVQQLIRADLEAAFQTFFNASSPTLGSQILDGTAISELRPHATLRDRLVVIIDTVIPYPLNNIDLFIVV